MSKAGDKGWAMYGAADPLVTNACVPVVCIGTMTTGCDVWRIVRPDGTHGDLVPEGRVFHTREDCVNWRRIV